MKLLCADDEPDLRTILELALSIDPGLDPTTASIPVVFLTAKTQQEEMRRAMALGATACLTKPFDPLTLATELRAALETDRE